jgi:UDP-GlcNAc:undecaprenyl-phosphate/decaprenyl-phosphate GlcNAc-1-phosphate transferase
MVTAATAFGLSLTCGAVFTPYVIRLARRMNAIDHAGSSRKIHTAPIPRLGGIAIVAAFFVPVVGLLLVNSSVGRLFYGDGLRPLGLFLGGGIIALLGIYDDLKGANAKVKFTVQFAVAVLVYALGYRIDAIANPFGPAFQLGWLGLPFTMIWIAGVINAINLIDGLDGLAGGVALVAVGTTFLFAVIQGAPLMMLFSAALAGALLGFLRYNVNPASIFMGDTGSMFLGFVLATSAITAHQKSSTTVALLAPIIVLGFPILDTLLAMSRRALRGAPLFAADRGHIHHRLLDLGLSHRQTVLVLWGASGLLGAAALAVAYASSVQVALLLVFLALATTCALRRLGFVRLERTAELLVQRRRNLARRAALRRIGRRLRYAAGMADVWETVKQAGPALGATCVTLRLDEQTARGHARIHRFVHCFERGEPRTCEEPCDGLVRTRHSLAGERPSRGSGAYTLKLGWRERPALDRDTELAVEQLCGSIQSALARIGPIGPEAVGNGKPSTSVGQEPWSEGAPAGRVVNLRR